MDWHHITPQWQATTTELKTGLPTEQLAAPWQMLLLGDGAVTRHLQLVTGEDIEVDVLAMESPVNEDGAPPEVSAILAPRLRRQVWLRTASGLRLAYATSWWGAAQVDTYLENRGLPIWKSLASKRTEHFRDLKGLCYGRNQTLENEFGQSGKLWARHYLLWGQGQPMTLIYEVFSPVLVKYLGKSANANE